MPSPLATAGVSERCRIPADDLRRRVDPASLPFKSTSEVTPLEGTVGQPRAVEALEFGVAMESPGYNLFVAGEQGSGRESTVREHLTRVARERPTPPDWMYVHNVRDPDRPRKLCVRPGTARTFATEIDGLLRAAEREIDSALESEAYEKKRHDVLAAFDQQRAALLDELRTFAREQGFHVEPRVGGFVTIPLIKGEPFTDEKYSALTPDEQKDLERRTETLETRATSAVRALRQIDRAADERRRALDSDVVRAAIQPLIDEIVERHRADADVVRFLQDIRDDLPARVIDARNGHAHRASDAEDGTDTDDDASADAQSAEFPSASDSAPRFDRLARYRANALVDHSDAPGAPVVFEPHPTPHNLAGRIEYRSIDGTLVTGVRQIKPGALHRANGGFLIMRALDVLQTEASWSVLKRALSGREIRVEPLGDPLLAIPTETLAPEPIPLDVKVVLIGTTHTFQLLYELEEDFQSLFKVKVEFAPDMAWTTDNLGHYAAFIARVVRDRGLHHFEAAAVARVMERGARLREHQERLSTRLLDVADVVTEASFWSGRAGRAEVSAHDVDEAIARREQRSNLIEEEVRRWITEGALRIDTEGQRVGTLNGLSVIDVGDHQFGRPVRVTAVASPGRGLVASIEREAGLSGATHDKGVLTITGLLASMFARDTPLSLSATISFEQNYDEIEGDSASVAELVALVSALGDAPVRQCIAITGSIDQQGNVQAVGGVNDKIEGFFALCQARGLNGEHGVVIPRTNARHLMLRDHVVDAVREGRFHVWAIETIDEALELATGLDATIVRASAARRLEGFASRVRWMSGGDTP